MHALINTILYTSQDSITNRKAVLKITPPKHCITMRSFVYTSRNNDFKITEDSIDLRIQQ
jgi:hypothetical protein